MLSRRVPAAIIPPPTPTSTEHAGRPDDTAAWLEALRADGATRDRAVAELHALLLSAARFTVHRPSSARTHLRETLEDIAQQSADDALVAVLGKLDGFRGESRFTTWAYKFAILETAVALRRHAWQGREIPLHDDGWRWRRDPGASPQQQAQTQELLGALGGAIDKLTDHQRSVLVAVTLDGVPIDVLAERLGTTRGALYKTLHDARRRLRELLAADGFEIGAIDVEGRS